MNQICNRYCVEIQTIKVVRYLVQELVASALGPTLMHHSSHLKGRRATSRSPGQVLCRYRYLQ
jgi:hypothetical protein